MIADEIIWNRLLAHVCARTHLQPKTVNEVMRAALEFLASLQREPQEG